MEKPNTEEMQDQEKKEEELLEYKPPRVVTYHADDLLEELGPAQACSFSGSVIAC